jgi:hypothetical protein
MGAVDQLDRGLGWFSVSLGVAELIAGGRLARWLGTQGHEPLIRAYGVREILSGVGTLSVGKTVGLWSRVGGDALDIVTLATGLREDNPKKGNVGLAMAAVIGVTLLDLYCAQELSKRKRRPDQPVRTTATDGDSHARQMRCAARLGILRHRPICGRRRRRHRYQTTQPPEVIAAGCTASLPYGF